MRPPFLLLYGLVLILFATCEQEPIVQNPAKVVGNCYTTDCVSSQNAIVVSTPADLNLRVTPGQPDQLHASLRSFWQAYEEDEQQYAYGLPAWNYLSGYQGIKDKFSQFHLPLITPKSASVEAIVVITAIEDEGRYSAELISKKDIQSYPGKLALDPFKSGLTSEFTQGFLMDAFQRFNVAIFGREDPSIRTRPGSSLFKDCVVQVFQTLDCYGVFGGANQERTLYYACNTGLETRTVCSGPTDPSGGVPGPSDNNGGGSGPGAGSGGPGGGPSTIIINRNRCDEDGVGCDEGDDNDNDRQETIVLDLDCKQNVCLCESVRRVMLLGGTGRIGQIINSIFNTSPKVNISISGSTDLPSSVWANHYATKNGPEYYNAFITFNLAKFRNCSREAYTATLLHESVHAYIQYQESTLSSGEFARRYPLWSSSNDSNTNHHREMAEKYVSYIAADLELLFPNLDSRTATLLAWGGLQGTKHYQNLSAAFRQEIANAESLAYCKNGSSESERQESSLSLCY